MQTVYITYRKKYIRENIPEVKTQRLLTLRTLRQ